MILKAKKTDIYIIEDILLDAVNWLNDLSNPLWTKEDIMWHTLRKNYSINDFYIYYLNDEPVGCMALLNFDPSYWADVKINESLFIHKLSVKRCAAKKGVSKKLIDYAKEQCVKLNIPTLKLDCEYSRIKLRSFYESQGFKLCFEKQISKTYTGAFYSFDIITDINVK